MGQALYKSAQAGAGAQCVHGWFNNGRHIGRPLLYELFIKEGGHAGTASTISPAHHNLNNVVSNKS